VSLLLKELKKCVNVRKHVRSAVSGPFTDTANIVAGLRSKPDNKPIKNYEDIVTCIKAFNGMVFGTSGACLSVPQVHGLYNDGFEYLIVAYVLNVNDTYEKFMKDEGCSYKIFKSTDLLIPNKVVKP